MPSKPLLGRPVVVGMSEAVIAIRSVLSAFAACGKQRHQDGGRKNPERRMSTTFVTRALRRVSMQVADQTADRASDMAAFAEGENDRLLNNA